MFCAYSGTNISRHLRTKHANETEVEEVIKPANDSKTMAKQLELIRMKGDHKHNLEVIDKKEGNLVIARRRRQSEFDSDQYGPCP